MGSGCRQFGIGKEIFELKNLIKLDPSKNFSKCFSQKQIHSVFGDTMFRDEFDVKLHEIDKGIDELNQRLKTAIVASHSNQFLVEMQEDFNTCLYPVVEAVADLHEEYILCCKFFDPVYVKYLGISKTKDKKTQAKFRATVKQWVGKVMMRYMIRSYVNYVENTIRSLAQENSLYLSILKNVKNSRTPEPNAMESWNALIHKALEAYRNISSKLHNSQCPDVNEFSKDLMKDLDINNLVEPRSSERKSKRQKKS